MQSIKFANPARDAKWVSEYSMALLREQMKESNVRSIIITSTYRSPEDQARVMFDNLSSSKSRRSMYAKHGQSVETVFRVYESSVKHGMVHGFDPDRPLPSAHTTRVTMGQRIQELESEFGIGCVSRHQANSEILNVLDISAGQVRPVAAVSKFIAGLTDSNLVSRIGLPKGSMPSDSKHFVETSNCIHLEIPQPNDGSGFSARNIA